MRIAIFIFVSALLAFGCSDSKNPVREYGSNLTGAVKKAEQAKVIADLTTIKMEIMRYKAENGEFPPSLQALGNKAVNPDLFAYDPATGTVSPAR